MSHVFWRVGAIFCFRAIGFARVGLAADACVERTGRCEKEYSGKPSPTVYEMRAPQSENAMLQLTSAAGLRMGGQAILNGSVAEAATPLQELCGHGSVRRRRLLSMRSCRRRYSSSGFGGETDQVSDPWKCNEVSNQMYCDADAVMHNVVDRVVGYPSQTSHQVKASGLWCQVSIPPPQWALKHCPFQANVARIRVKALTYNLFWWRLFNQLGGGHRSVGKLIAKTSGHDQYDLMAFQECDDRWRVLNDAKLEGLSGDYEAIDGGRALAIAFRRSRWGLLASGVVDVGEDDSAQYYGRRGAHWVRLRHRDGRTIFFMNHHGPLPVSWGGGCTGSATSMNILREIATHAHTQDAIILTGDFNAEAHSSRIKQMDKHLHRVYSGTSMGGVDHFFSNCAEDVAGANLGKGVGEHGSDHDAIGVTFRL